ncbi:MAG: hypothetical protein IKL89_02930 [Clostridia bacterium]|nr:hypothetical protein [Clostridia bacterium]
MARKKQPQVCDDAVYTVNLEDGLPLCHEAINRFKKELEAATERGIAVMKLIHGYGSSGSGGKLRIAIRRHLDGCKLNGFILDYIEGEKFDIFDARTQKALQTHPELARDRDLQRHNNGITVVLVSRSK